MKRKRSVTLIMHFSSIVSWQGVFLSLVLLLFISLSGCAGPKFSSMTPDNYNYFKGDIIPENKSVSIRSHEPRDKSNDAAKIKEHPELEVEALFTLLDNINAAHELFVEVFYHELEKSNLFNKIFIIDYNEKANTDLVFEIKHVSSGGGGQASRIMIGSMMYLSAQGELVDVQQNKVIFEFKQMRTASGGLIGAGGLLAASNETMNKQLSKWISEDIIENIKKKRSH